MRDCKFGEYNCLFCDLYANCQSEFNSKYNEIIEKLLNNWHIADRKITEKFKNLICNSLYREDKWKARWN